MGLVSDHGWPLPRAEAKKAIALPYADQWAKGRGAESFDDYVKRHPRP
jgi:hypothetical protein